MPENNRNIRADIFARGQDARGLGVLDAHLLSEDEDQITVDERATELAQLTFLKGCIWWAADLQLDLLFGDLTDFDTPEFVPMIINQLPDQHRHLYDGRFIRKFLVAALDQFAGITAGWCKPKCVAQELVMGILMDQVEATAELFNIALPEDWREYMVDGLMWDDDYLVMFEPEMDGIWNDEDAALSSMVDMDFSKWFWPLEADRDRLPPFLWG